MKIRLYCALFITLTLAFSTHLKAQDGQDPLLISSQMLRVNSSFMPLSGANVVMPSVATENGFASFIDNPASMALVKSGFFSAGVAAMNRRDQVNTFGNQQSQLPANPITNNTGLLSDIGFVYKAPTVKGSLVIGAGYSLQQDFSRSNEFNEFNQLSSITDNFRLQGPRSIYFNTFATDWGDDQQTFVESIFRLGQTADDQFLGIDQTGEITQNGYMGELSVFGAVEFKKNIFIGLSLGATFGKYGYERRFIERDIDNIYNLDIIDNDGRPETPGTDIQSLAFYDEVNADLSGFTARIGSIFKLNEQWSVGASATIPTKLEVKESFISSSASFFDNGSILDDDTRGDNIYRINRPSRYSTGFSATGYGNFEFSAAVDYIRHAELDVETTADQLKVIQNETNDYVSSNFRSVFNYRLGGSYEVNEQIKLRASYAYLPAKTELEELDQNIFAAGFSLKLNPKTIMDVSTQYSEFDDRSILYSYVNFNNRDVSEFITEEIRVVNLFVSFRILF